LKRGGSELRDGAISALFVEWKKDKGEAVDQLTYLNAPGSEYLVDQRDGVIAGFVWIWEHMIVNIITRARYRRQGIAEGLMRAAQERRNMLRLEVELRNEEAICLYLKCGFAESDAAQPGSILMEWRRAFTHADT
jgi:ribosomal protein S18 acetylase RimI-like enzyme